MNQYLEMASRQLDHFAYHEGYLLIPHLCKSVTERILGRPGRLCYSEVISMRILHEVCIILYSYNLFLSE